MFILRENYICAQFLEHSFIQHVVWVDFCRDGIVRVLGSVWFAELTYWSNGVNPSSSMGDNLASAAELLLG